MKKNLHHSLMQTLICVLLTISASATTTDTVFITPPAYLATCMPDTFTATFYVSGTVNLSIHDSLDFNTITPYSSCSAGGSSHITTLHILNSTPSGLNFTYSSGSWSTGNFTYTGIVTVRYVAWIDCGIVPSGSTGSGNIDLIQIWKDLNNVYTFYFASSSSDTLQTLNIRVPIIKDLTSLHSPFYVSYNDVDTINYIYKNDGTANANIRFTFDPHSLLNCGIDSILSLDFAIGDTGSITSLTYSPLVSGNQYSALIPETKALIVRKRILPTGCTNTCNNEHVKFSWTCNDSLNIAAFPLCDSCQQIYNIPYVLDDTLSSAVTLKRIAPGGVYSSSNDTAFWDHTCMGDSLNWEYRIVNNGKQILPYVLLDFSHPDGYNSLTLIDTANIHITPCTNCIVTDSIDLMTTASCSASIIHPLKRLRIYIFNFGKNDSLSFRFSTYRCCEQNDLTLMNVKKYFNRWTLGCITKDACNVPATVNITNSYSGSSGGISSNWQNSAANLDLALDFTPTVNDLNVPQTSTNGFGDTSALIFVDFKNLFNSLYDYQLLGCNSTAGACTYHGYLQVKFHCDTGIVVFNPLDSVRFTKVGSSAVWHPVYYYKTVPDSVCRDGYYYLYFDLSNPVADTMITNSHLEFYLQACCTAPPTSSYTVAFYLLPDPTGSCASLSFPGGNQPPVCTSGNCCFLPLSETGSLLNVHCPGCLSIGVESDFYTLNRTNFGFADANNNMKCDTPVTAINSTYLSNNGKFMKPYLANHADFLEDRLTAHTQEADPTSGGYGMQYLNDSSVFLKVLQLYRTITPLDSTQIGLTPFYMKLYIDTPDSTATPADCKDCIGYTQNINHFRTQCILEADTLDSLNFYIVSQPDQFRYLFTFDATNASSNIYHNVIYTDSIHPFSGFFEDQRYRLKVYYGIKKFFSPASYLAINQSLTEQRKAAQIVNFMFLSGVAHPIDSIHSLPEMPNDTSGLPHPLTQNFGDSHAFICAPNGGKFYFYSDEAINIGGFRNQIGNRCHRYMEAMSIARTGGASPTLEKYPLEFRLPSFKPYSYKFYVPPGYKADTLGQVRSSYDQINFTSPHTFNVPAPVSDTITIKDSLFTVICFSDTMNYTGVSLYNGDHNAIRDIRITLHPLFCDPDSVYPRKPNDILIQFRDNNVNCNGTFTPYTDTLFTRQTVTMGDTLKTPQPNLSLLFTPPQTTDTVAKVCWKYKLYVTNDDAYYAFIVPEQVAYFTNWTLYHSGTIHTANANNIIGIDSILKKGTYSDTLCASQLHCHPDTSLSVYFGWNCDTFPSGPFPDTTVCSSQIDTISFINGTLTQTDSLIIPTSYDLCTPFYIGGSFTSVGTGSIYPYQVTLDSASVPYGLVPIAAYLISCPNPTDTALLQQSSSFTWNVTSANLDSIGIPDSALSNTECVYAIIKMEPTCQTGGLDFLLPDVTLNAISYCGDPADFVASKNTLLGYSGVSNCKDCFTLTKIALQDTVAAGDTIAAFNIIICGNNDSSYVVSLHEFLPTGFIPTSTIPATDTVPKNGCDTITVFGHFDSTGTCSSLINTVQIITPSNDTLTADTCITVLSPCYVPGAIIFPDSTFSTQYNPFYVNDTILVEGRFYVDSAFALYNCRVYVAPGGQIIVLQNGFFYVSDSTDISGCTNMWRRIELQAKSSFAEDRGSNIRDAEYALYANDSSQFKVQYSGMTNCITGIYTPPNASSILNNIGNSVVAMRFGLYAPAFKPDFVGQIPHDSLPRAGIEVNDMIMNIGSSSSTVPNSFYHLNTGITGIRSILTIQNSQFWNIRQDNFYKLGFNGTAIADTGKRSDLTVYPLTSGLNTIYNSYRGIYTDMSKLLAKQVSIINVNTGIYSTHCFQPATSLVTGCTIDCKRWGIRWENNTGTGGMNAEYNTITIHHSRRAAISLSETSSSLPVLYGINGNVIYTDSTNDAIHAMNVHRPAITYNQIHISGIPDTLYSRGIRINGCTGAYVTCNSVKGPYPANKLNRGIVTTISDNSFISCNSVDSTYYGVFFGGICLYTTFEGNKMYRHYDGLYLNNVAVIDTQNHSGNKWLGTYGSGYGAVNMNDTPTVNLFYSLFVVDTVGGSTFFPATPIINPNDVGWFQFGSGGYFDCASSTICGATRDDKEGSKDLKKLIARDSTITSDFIPESKMIAKQYLYDDLMRDSALTASDSVFQNFITANATASIGYLYDTKTAMKATKEFDSTLTVALSQTDNSVKIYSDSVSYIDSLATSYSINDYSSQRQELIDAVSSYQQIIKDSLQNHEPYVSSKFSEAETKNNSVSPDELPDNNEKFINSVEIKFQKEGKDSIAEFYQQFLDIATQCPYKGGLAVYRARPFVAMFNDTIEYDDDNTCALQGIFRLTENKNAIANNNIKIIPNPATDKTDIILEGDYEGICSIIVNDALGKKQIEKRFNCTEKKYSLNVANLSPGVYFVEVRVNNNDAAYAKIIIAK